MRKRLWYYLRRNVMIGAILPTWLLYVRAVLFPLDTFYWKMSESRGYDYEYDVWRIGGITYSAEALSDLAKSQGDTFKVTRVNNTIVLRKADKRI